tara:strand:- start:10667 stop:11962 length:1296 start_codon:yes stop_codon:yes gene_type:complete
MTINNLITKLKNNQLFKDSAWSLLGNVVGRGLALVAGILVARFLGKDVFGEYGIIKNTILTIGVFSTFGLGYTATKYIAEFKALSRDKIPLFIKTANKITFTFSGFMALLLFVFADYVAFHWLEAAHLGTPLRILAVLIIFNAITTTQIGILSGFGKFKEIAKINSIVGVLTFLFSVLLTYYFDLNGALLALLLVQVINCILNYYAVKRETKTIDTLVQQDKTMLKGILNFSTPIALQEAVYAITSWLASLLLIKYATYGDLGMYTAAMQWNAIILFIPGILRNVILSHLSENTNNQLAHNKILKQTIAINFIATLIPCILVFIFSGLIAKSYGQTFDGLAILISLACFITIFSSISNVYSQAYMSKGINWLMLRIRLFRDFGIVVLAYFLLNFTNSDFNGALLLILSVLTINILFLLLMFIIYNKTLVDE